MARGVGTGGSLTVNQQLLFLAIHLVLFFFGCVVSDIIHHVHAQLQQHNPAQLRNRQPQTSLKELKSDKRYST